MTQIREVLLASRKIVWLGTAEPVHDVEKSSLYKTAFAKVDRERAIPVKAPCMTICLDGLHEIINNVHVTFYVANGSVLESCS